MSPSRSCSAVPSASNGRLEHDRAGRGGAAHEDHQPADVRERHRAQPALVAVGCRARRRRRGCARRGCRTSARPRRGARVVPEVWTTSATSSSSGSRTLNGAPPSSGSGVLDDAPRRRAVSSLRSRSPSRGSTGMAGARSSRQACRATTKSRPGGQRRAPRGRPARRRAATSRAGGARGAPSAARGRSAARSGVSSATASGRRAVARASQGSISTSQRLMSIGVPVEWTPAGEYEDIRYEVGRRDREDHHQSPGGPQRVPARDADRDLGRAGPRPRGRARSA